MHKIALMLALSALTTGLVTQPAQAQSTPTPCALRFNQALFVPVAGRITGIAIDERCERVYATNATDNQLEVFTVDSAALGAPIFVGSLPASLDFSPDASRIYVANRGGASISVVDVAQQAEIDRIQVPRGRSGDTPFSLAVAQDGKVFFSTTFAGSGFGGRVLQLDPATRTTSVRNDFDGGSTTEATTLRASADRSVIGAAVGDISSGPVVRYTSATDSWSPEVRLETFVSQIALNANGDIGIVDGGGTFVLDRDFNQIGLIPGGRRGGVAVDGPGLVGYRIGESRIDVLNLVRSLRVGSLAIGDTIDGFGSPFGNSSGELVLSRDGSLLAVITDRGFALVPTGVGQGQPFAALSANAVLEGASDARAGSLRTSAELTLGANSNGIDPLVEPVAVQVGAVSIEIPAGSFIANGTSFEFTGTLDGVDVDAALDLIAPGQYRLALDAQGIDPTGTSLPPIVAIAIGDDTGTRTTADYRVELSTTNP